MHSHSQWDHGNSLDKSWRKSWLRYHSPGPVVTFRIYYLSPWTQTTTAESGTSYNLPQLCLPSFPRHESYRSLAVILFHFNSVRWTWFGSLQDWHRVGYFWLRQCRCASEICWATNQKVWSKKDVHHEFPGSPRLRRSISYSEALRSAFWEG